MLRYAVVNGALWAVGSAWSTAIRSMVLEVLPSYTRIVIVGELIAATTTTLLAVSVSYVVMRSCAFPPRRPVLATETRHRTVPVRRSGV